MTDIKPLFPVDPTPVQTILLYLHEVAEAPLAEDIFEEHQVFFVVGIWVELRGEQGQGLMKPYRKKSVLCSTLIIYLKTCCTTMSYNKNRQYLYYK